MPKTEAVTAAPMRVLKVNTCPSISGHSTLTYHVRCNAVGDVHLCVVQNSGSGKFNSDAVPLSLIEKLLTQYPADKPMTSRVMLPMFRSKSSNSPAFLFAALISEGLVKAGKEEDSGYSIGDFDAFKQAMSALIASNTNLDAAVAASPEVTKRKRKESA